MKLYVLLSECIICWRWLEKIKLQPYTPTMNCVLKEFDILVIPKRPCKYWNQGCGRETLISCDEGDLLHAGRRGCFFFPWKSFHRILSGRWQCLDAQWLALPLFREVHWFPDIWMHDSTSTLLIYCFIWNANLGVFCIYWFLQEENKTTHQFLCDK